MSISFPAMGLSPLPPLEPLNPSNPPQPTQVEPSNCMERIVQWLTSYKTPLLLKIGAVALTVIATAAVGILVGYPLLVSAIVLIPTTIWALIVWARLALKESGEAIAEIVADAEESRQAVSNIQNAVGGEAAFNQLPVLDIGNHTGATGYIDFLEPNDLRESVMRGTDAAGRPFISLKMRFNASEPFVITFFQRYRTGGRWTWGTSAPNPFYRRKEEPFGNVLGPQDLATIRQIVVDRNHPRFRLV